MLQLQLLVIYSAVMTRYSVKNDWKQSFRVDCVQFLNRNGKKIETF